jgi:hypothetical protein
MAEELVLSTRVMVIIILDTPQQDLTPIQALAAAKPVEAAVVVAQPTHIQADGDAAYPDKDSLEAIHQEAHRTDVVVGVVQVVQVMLAVAILQVQAV